MLNELDTNAASIEARTIRKMRIRILPFIFLLYIVAFLDRLAQLRKWLKRPLRAG